MRVKLGKIVRGRYGEYCDEKWGKIGVEGRWDVGRIWGISFRLMSCRCFLFFFNLFLSIVWFILEFGLIDVLIICLYFVIILNESRYMKWDNVRESI